MQENSYSDYSESRKKSIGHCRAPTPIFKSAQATLGDRDWEPELNRLSENYELVEEELDDPLKDEDDDELNCFNKSYCQNHLLDGQVLSYQRKNSSLGVGHARKSTPFISGKIWEESKKQIGINDESFYSKKGSISSDECTPQSEEHPEIFDKGISDVYQQLQNFRLPEKN